MESLPILYRGSMGSITLWSLTLEPVVSVDIGARHWRSGIVWSICDCLVQAKERMGT